MLRKFSFFVVALVSLCFLGVEAYADETDPQVGTKAKGTYFKAIFVAG